MKRNIVKGVEYIEEKKVDKEKLSKNVRVMKLLGYCPSCYLMIGDKDISEGHFSCPSCGKSGDKGKLKKDNEKIQLYNSRKDYMADINGEMVRTSHSESLDVTDDENVEEDME